jgi:serine/threonine-protein kinase
MAKPGDRIGPYILAEKLGRGAFGVMWLAEKQTVLATTRVALKMPDEEEVDMDAVRQEASVWVQASGHPNVLPIIDADVYDGQVVIVSEYAPDGSLTKWLGNNGGRAPSHEAAIEMTLGILSGLEHLHSRGIIHRDLKPDNILLQRETPRLADFGIARIPKTTSKSTVVSGTPYYMPPEAFDGKRSERTDTWSVGVMLYQLLTGTLPFPQTDITSLLAAIITKEPAPTPDSLPQPLKDVLRKALEKNPELRYQTATEMRRDLREALRQLSSSNAETIKVPVASASPVSVPLTEAEPELQFQPRWITVPRLVAQEQNEANDGEDSTPRKILPDTSGDRFISHESQDLDSRHRQQEVPPPAKSSRRFLVVGGVAALVLIGLLLVSALAAKFFFPETFSALTGGAKTYNQNNQNQSNTAPNANANKTDADVVVVPPLSIVRDESATYELIKDKGDLIGVYIVVDNLPDNYLVKLDDRQAEVDEYNVVQGVQNRSRILAAVDFASKIDQMRKNPNAPVRLPVEVIDRDYPDNKGEIAIYIDPKKLGLDKAGTATTVPVQSAKVEDIERRNEKVRMKREDAQREPTQREAHHTPQRASNEKTDSGHQSSAPTPTPTKPCTNWARAVGKC